MIGSDADGRVCVSVAVDPLIEFLFATASGVRGASVITGGRDLLQSDSCAEKVYG